eukprot:TRINITY_DN42532_c0_g1_i1.p1 TRINITY_DN42532_c0_g1~~TRINITY_DN42532_c0_g1_i1.p1  ORF type:complete len:354 (+),score=60.24 TRINITY_DN42532_c0_g1_i1:140-1201(+)
MMSAIGVGAVARAARCSSVLVAALWQQILGSEVAFIRNLDASLDPVYVPDFLFDLASSAAVLEAMRSVPALPFSAGPLDDLIPEAPAMFPMLVWRVSERWDAQRQAFTLGIPGTTVTTVYVDVGAHTWSRFLPLLRREPGALLVCFEPTRTSFTELYRRLKLDYPDLLQRVLALPVAADLKPNDIFRFQALHTNSFWNGECNSLLTPDHASDILPECTEKGSVEIVPVMPLPVVLMLVLNGIDRSARSPTALLDIKIDAQGADLAIMETFAAAPNLMEEIRQVQLEVQEVPLYHGQPLKSEVIARMRDLGFALNQDISFFDDGGRHTVIAGCASHEGDAVGTEDCFFVPARDR